MKGSDFIAKFVKNLGSDHAFVLTGGACAHLIDSLGRLPGFHLVCVQHEQAGAMAAECYSRLHKGMGVTVVTSGPGATNLITGIACAWFDSIPMLNLSGQVNTFESKGNLGIRQMGFQETDIVPMVKGITKFAKKVEKPEDLKATLQEAVYWALEGRKGPVLVDIPFNMQTADIDFDATPDFVPPALKKATDHSVDYKKILEKLVSAKRPVLMVGGGVKLGESRQEFLALADALKIPIVTTWSGLDVVSADHPLYRGQVGVYGSRAANFTVQNADFLLSVGSRIDSRITGGKYKSFAREAFRVVIDIDASEIDKGRVDASLPLCMDAKVFCSEFVKLAKPSSCAEWVQESAQWVKEFPVYDRSVQSREFVNPYLYFDYLSRMAPKDALVISDCGGNLTWTVQGFAPTGQQRVISAMGNSPMGYAFPAAIGAHFAAPGKPLYCVIGDGGLQINLQEFQTIVHYKIPMKLMILNNRGYGIIKQFQDLYLEGRHIATGEGYSSPDYSKIAEAYGLPYVHIDNDHEVEAKLSKALAMSGPVVIDVRLKDDQKIDPKLGWGKPIEDQLPLLSRDVFKKHMHIKPLEEEAVKQSKNEIN